MLYPLVSAQGNDDLYQQWLNFKQRNSKQAGVIRLFIEGTAKAVLERDELDVSNFLERHAKEASTWNYKLSTLRQFYAWLLNRDRHLPPRKWKPPAFFEFLEWKTVVFKYGPEDMWTEDDILMAIETCDHPRDKAIVAFGYDIGPRPHELLAPRIRSIVMKENYALVKLRDHSNPEGRTVPLTFSYPYVLAWLNCHPLKDQLDAPLWVRIQGVPKAITYATLWYLCCRILKNKLQHKIQKPFNPYCMFDHSRFSNLAEDGQPLQDICDMRGWSLNSKMPQRYIHLTGRGMTERMLARAGLLPDKERKESPLKPKKCYRCNFVNAPDANYCIKCNFVISYQGYQEFRDKEKNREQEFEEMKQKMKVYDDLLGKFMGNKLKVSMENGVTRLQEK